MADQPPAQAKAKAAKARPCPICGKPPVEGMAPFCSKRCADVDLHRWLGGAYAVPTDEPADGGTPGDRESGEES